MLHSGVFISKDNCTLLLALWYLTGFFGLVLQVSFRVQYPEDYLDLSYEDLKEFKQTRYGNGLL